MANPALLIAALVFVTVILLSVSLASYLESRQERRKLLGRIQGEAPGRSNAKLSARSSQNRAVKDQIVKLATAVGKKVKPESGSSVSPLKVAFLRAGYRQHNILIAFYGAKTLLAVILPALVIMIKLFAFKSMALTSLTILTVGVAVVGFYIPNLWLQFKVSKRREQMLEGFPDALDLMVVCVEAGMGIDAVIQRVGSEMKMRNKVVSEEFHYLSLELRAGKSRADAMRNLAMRANLEDVSSLVTLLIQTDRFGTSVSQALRVHSTSMRTKRYQRAEEMAAKLPVKLVFPLICFIFPALFVVIVGPAVIKIIRAFTPYI
jgi:tight adherence protein C